MFVIPPRYASPVAAMGAAVGGVWTQTFAQTLNTDSASWNGNTIRQHIGANLLSTSGSKVRLTLEGPSAEGMQVAAMWIGHAAASGDLYDFDGTQVQILVSGSGGFTVGIGATVVTDEVTYAFDETKAFIIAAYFSNSAQDTLRGRNAAASVTVYFKAANEPSTTNVTGYSTTASALRMVNQIEVFV